MALDLDMDAKRQRVCSAGCHVTCTCPPGFSTPLMPSPDTSSGVASELASSVAVAAPPQSAATAVAPAGTAVAHQAPAALANWWPRIAGVPGVVPAVGPAIRSVPRTNENKEYSWIERWGQSTWSCPTCNAFWIMYRTQPNDRGVIEVAFHQGFQESNGDPRECPDCQVSWVPR